MITDPSQNSAGSNSDPSQVPVVPGQQNNQDHTTEQDPVAQLPTNTDLTHFRRVVSDLVGITALLDSGADTRSSEAAQARVNFSLNARRHQNNPDIAEYLTNTMLTSDNPFLRDSARDALSGSTNERVQRAFELEGALRDISKGGGMFGSGPDNPERTQQTLYQLNDDSVFVDRMIEHVQTGQYGSYYVANAIRKSPLSEKQPGLRETILDSLEGDFSYFNRNKMSGMPLTLDPQHPETEEVLIKAVKAGPSDLGNFDAAAIASLGEIQTEAAREVVLHEFYKPRHNDWNVARAAADATKKQLTGETHAELAELVNGSLAKSAWVLAEKQGYSGIGRLLRTAGLLTDSSLDLHNKRVQAAIALGDVEPELAQKVFLDVTYGGKKGSMHQKCHFFAAGDALRGLKALPAVA